MKLSDSDLLAFSKANLSTFNLSKYKINKDLAIKSLQEDLNEEFNDLNSEETKLARLKYFNIQGASADDFSERVIKIDDKRKLICGIRHEGGNVELPFVQIIPNFSASDKEISDFYRQYLKSLFKVFEPRYVRVWSDKIIESVLIGSTYLVSTYGQIERVAKWPKEEEISFKNISDDSYYDWYKTSYNDFHEANKDLKDRVTINSPETMRSSINDGLLKYVYLDEKKIGLIAAKRSKFLGHEGFYFNEILIDKGFKGTRLARAIQRKFITEFSKPNDFIWGTVDYQNKPSYKTAVSNGRTPVRFECFIPV
ncbi:MAG: hypothetical protein R3B45_16305 [Bdellovibrionota bacterium]